MSNTFEIGASAASESAPSAGEDPIINPSEVILVTGASGFIGARVVRNLLGQGYRVRAFVRPSSASAELDAAAREHGNRLEIFKGNLLSREHCIEATRGISVILHLAAGRGEKSFPDAYMNSVVTTRNLLEGCALHNCLKRFVNVSSFAVYTNTNKRHWRLLDETCAVEPHPERRGDAYCFAKVKQDEIVTAYGHKFAIPWVIVRPGYVYGPGKEAITGRVGIGTFGIFLHLGGFNRIPFTYVDNCADAIVATGLKKGIDGEVFNIVDDDLPTSRRFLHLYKRKVRSFRSIYVPHVVSYFLCGIWEWYSTWSKGQLPPAFTRKKWHSFWKSSRYSNKKLKTRVGWRPKVSTEEGFERFFQGCRRGGQDA